MEPRRKEEKQCQYLVKLQYGLDAAIIQQIADLQKPPTIAIHYESDSTFAIIDAATRAALDDALPPGLTFVPLPQSPLAEKDLSDFSIAPTLGVDATLPQHRISTPALPRQDQFPVPYFFYGTLTDPERLSMLLCLRPEDDAPKLSAAMVRKGRTRKWGPYLALVDGTEEDCVRGCVYEVQCEEHEYALRDYEGDNYEVVRCEIDKGGEVVPGLTFRFCGDEESLD
ncbi:hypothetical protein N0V90_000127 [Kalmusia sp. IMI 367209]|nr:hypothetical protein N0V90_000127 [Kalmusia sp. IMI 367209]